MWKQTVGDWHERRSHRGGPAPVTPQSNLPESVASTEHSARGFLPPTFKDKRARAAYPVADGADARLDGAPLEQRAAARANTEAWVSITGASPDDVLDVRDFLDANVGRTVSHYMPPPTRVRSDTVYVQFASALQAAQAVRSVTFTTRVESGVAAIGVRRDVDRAAAAEPSTAHFYLEIVVSWCTDQIFIAERESLRRQLRESAAPTPLHSQPGITRASVASDNASAAATRSLASSGRGSEPLATSGAAAVTHDDDDGAAAHPLLPRHRGGASQSTPSPWSSRDSTASPSPPQQQQPQARGEPPVRDAASHFQAGTPYRAEDAYFSDGLHSDHHDGRQRNTMLSLFIHPCSAPYGVAYSFCLYRPLRLLVFLLWTLWNAARQLLSPPNAAAAGTSQGRKAAVRPLSQWRQRRTLRMADVVPASASPWDYLSFFLYAYVPFTPEPADVDVVLWSWLALHSPYPQRSLGVLKQSLLVRQRSTDQMVGRLRRGGGVGGDDDEIGGSEVHQLASFGRVDVLGGEPSPGFVRSQYQQQSERHRELPVLLRWRPAWWFARHSALSLAVIAALVCYRLWCTTE